MKTNNRNYQFHILAYKDTDETELYVSIRGDGVFLTPNPGMALQIKPENHISFLKTAILRLSETVPGFDKFKLRLTKVDLTVTEVYSKLEEKLPIF